MIPILIVILAFVVLTINSSFVGMASAVLIIVIVGLGRRESLMFNPYFLFLSTPISLLLYSDSVSRFFLPAMGINVQLIIIGGIYAYLAGLLTLGSVGGGGRVSNPPNYSFKVILALGIVPHILGIAMAGVPILANDVDVARANYVLPIIGQFMIFLPVTMLIAFQRRDKALIYFSIALNVFFSFIVLSKYSIMFTGFFLIYSYYRYDGKGLFSVRPAHLIILALVCVPILFEAIFSFRGGLSQDEYFWRQEVMFQSSFLHKYGDYTYLPYLYLTTPWSNFSFIVELQPGLGFSDGARTIGSLASVFQLDGLLSIAERPIREFPFNTHAFLSDFYLDFGILGVIVLPYFLGVLVKWSYINAFIKADVLSEGVWLSIAFASFMLFFSNHFTGLTYPLLSLLLFNFYRAVSRAMKDPVHKGAGES